MTDFRTFVLKLVAAFGAPWLLLIVWPSISYQSLAPIAYNKDKGDELDGAYMFPMSSVNHSGATIYAQEGCAQCHSQMIRPPQMGLDAWRKGWGQDQSDRPAEPTRATVLRDYVGEKYAYLGVSRIGPDLANAGYRFENATQVHLHLYEPKAVNPWSTMPSYKHLYIVRKQQGPDSTKALPLVGTAYAPRDGFEVVPTPEAEQLAAYILSLKRDYPIPGSKALAAAPAKK
ncbi:MAG: cbb3-type cytochrome c oxidase subunit II [Verrucomicrobiaceae bacterium]|nr:cbb3-type cytochrome c oxidase subunit II [Verrucomicrobiaceae bacterium]